MGLSGSMECDKAGQQQPLKEEKADETGLE